MIQAAPIMDRNPEQKRRQGQALRRTLLAVQTNSAVQARWSVLPQDSIRFSVALAHRLTRRRNSQRCSRHWLRLLLWLNVTPPKKTHYRQVRPLLRCRINFRRLAFRGDRPTWHPNITRMVERAAIIGHQPRSLLLQLHVEITLIDIHGGGRSSTPAGPTCSKRL